MKVICNISKVKLIVENFPKCYFAHIQSFLLMTVALNQIHGLSVRKTVRNIREPAKSTKYVYFEFLQTYSHIKQAFQASFVGIF